MDTLVHVRATTAWLMHLIGGEEGVEVIYKCQSPHPFVVQVNTVVCICEPNNVPKRRNLSVSRYLDQAGGSLVAIDRLALQEM